jgi:hypothetical protein
MHNRLSHCLRDKNVAIVLLQLTVLQQSDAQQAFFFQKHPSRSLEEAVLTKGP